MTREIMKCLSSLYTVMATIAISISIAWTTHAASETREMFLRRIVGVTIDYPRRADGSPRPIFEADLYINPRDATGISREQIRQALNSYRVVTEEEWTHPQAHIVGNHRQAWTGLVIMSDAQTIRWLMPQDGLLCLRYPDGRWLYLLADEITRKPHKEQAWEPVKRRQLELFAAGAADRCEANAATEQEAQGCIKSLILGEER